MKILVTGGAGYIGSHTCLALKKAGHEPIVLDSLVTGHEWAVKYGPFVKGDIADEETVRQLCAEYRPQALIHFAGFIDVAESVEQPAKYFENNFEKAQILFDTVLDCGIKKAVFSSTAAVYGSPESEEPIKETHPLRPINPYGESKLRTENYLRELEGKGMRFAALRYFNAAGAASVEEAIGEAHDPETHLIPNMLLAGLGKREGLSVFGDDYPTRDGTALRDYVHVMDLAAAHMASIGYLIAGGKSGAFNVGSGYGATVLEVLQTASWVMGKEIPYSLKTRRAGDPPFLLADISKIRDEMAWSPEYSLAEIIETALAWHNSNVCK
ncbi:MAG: UDP-glucose 4-epimerase GalE [Bdellovibrionales bacterium]